jgi:hypothetical protein
MKTLLNLIIILVLGALAVAFLIFVLPVLLGFIVTTTIWGALIVVAALVIVGIASLFNKKE